MPGGSWDLNAAQEQTEMKKVFSAAEAVGQAGHVRWAVGLGCVQSPSCSVGVCAFPAGIPVLD